MEDSAHVRGTAPQARGGARPAGELPHGAALLSTSTTVEDVLEVEQVVARARWHRAAVVALRDDEAPPVRRDSCYFDLRHGPSTTDASWTSPAGTELTVAVCGSDARRLADGEPPAARMVRVADRYMPWHELGDVAALVDHARRLTGAASANRGHHSHLTRHPSFEGSEGLT